MKSRSTINFLVIFQLYIDDLKELLNLDWWIMMYAYLKATKKRRNCNHKHTKLYCQRLWPLSYICYGFLSVTEIRPAGLLLCDSCLFFGFRKRGKKSRRPTPTSASAAKLCWIIFRRPFHQGAILRSLRPWTILKAGIIASTWCTRWVADVITFFLRCPELTQSLGVCHCLFVISGFLVALCFISDVRAVVFQFSLFCDLRSVSPLALFCQAFESEASSREPLSFPVGDCTKDQRC